MSFEENLKRGRYPTPYLYLIKQPNQCLFYIGVHHSFDNPEDFQFAIIKHYFNEYNKITSISKCSVVIEGAKRDISHETEESAKKSEIHYTAWLASQVGLDHVCLEPPIKKEAELLIKEFSRDEVIFYYFLRSLQNWIQRRDKPPLEEYNERIMKQYLEGIAWADYDFSTTHMDSLFVQFIGGTFNPEKPEIVVHMENPFHTDNVISKVSRRSGEIRDEHIVNEIKNLWIRGENIFIVYGMNHAIVQEPAIRSFII